MILLDEKSFNTLFREWYPVLCRFAFKFIENHDVAEDIVQEVFVNLWKGRMNIELETSISAYLFASTRYNCLHQLKKDQKKVRMLEKQSVDLVLNEDEQIELHQLEQLQQLYLAVERLPVKTKQVFILSKMEGLTYDEIADHLGVSVKTVEKQMSAALQKLRTDLKSKRKSD